MLSAALSLSLLGLASAAPLNSRVTPNYPSHGFSTGFRLVANVTDPSQDLTPSINNWYFGGIHVGAGLNDATLSSSEGQIFFLNGTAEQVRFGQTNVLTDEGTQNLPFGISVQNETEFDGIYTTEHDVSINGGPGTDVTLTQFPNPYTYLAAAGGGSFVACNQTVPYYQQNFIVVRYAYNVWNDVTKTVEPVIPEGCVAINLIPECAVLPDLPAGSLDSHDFAANVTCYPDVSAIEWSQYGP